MSSMRCFEAAIRAPAVDWFLAGKSHSFWIVGLSLDATLIDSAELVPDTGGTDIEVIKGKPAKCMGWAFDQATSASTASKP